MKGGDIVIYKTEDNDIELEVTLKKETIWLDQKAISKLFGVQRPAITKHIRNIFSEGELDKNSVCSKMEHTAKDKKKYKTIFYNLDMIISIGYRVNSKQATQFRIWSTNVLKRYIKEGYVVNQKKLEKDSEKWELLQLQMKNLRGVLDSKQLTNSESKALIEVVTDYSKALELLDNIDSRSIPERENPINIGVINLKYDDLEKDINKLREQLKEGELFGQDNNKGLESIFKSINQSFDNKDLYSSTEIKAANLLYLIIKNHPFIDGNKRIGSFMFLKYLYLNDILYKEDGSKKIEQNTLVAIALLLAQSNSKEKDIMIDLVVYMVDMN